MGRDNHANAHVHDCGVSQVEFVVAFIGTTLARAVAAPLNSNYKKVRVSACKTATLAADELPADPPSPGSTRFPAGVPAGIMHECTALLEFRCLAATACHGYK